MKAQHIADYLGIPLRGESDLEIRSVAELDQAGKDQLSFVESEKHLPRARRSRAGCLLVPEGADLADRTLLLSPRPRYDFIRAVEFLMPAPRPEPGIHPDARIHSSAKIAGDATVGPFVVVEPGAEIESMAQVDAHCFIGSNSRVGQGTHLYPRVVLYSGVQVGNRCILHSGTVVGADGFGYMPWEGRHVKFPQRGRVEIEDEVEIGANVCIDRAALGCTRIGRGTKIDNLVQIAHNVEIGPHCLIVSLTGISGSSVLEDHVTLAGQVGVGEHAHIQRNAVVGGQSGVLNGKILRGGALYWGTPARPMASFQEQHRLLASLPGLRREVEKLKQELALREKLGEN